LVRILVIADTHLRTAGALSPVLLRQIAGADCVIHCGDFVSTKVVEELQRLSRRFVGVYGNADPDSVRSMLPAETTFLFDGKEIAVIHPYWGGDGYGLEDKLTTRYPRADVILFGHTHEPCNLMMNNTLLFNPGQAYTSFMVPASAGILTINEDGVSAEIINAD
jgi:putative phosphoesterase